MNHATGIPPRHRYRDRRHPYLLRRVGPRGNAGYFRLCQSREVPSRPLLPRIYPAPCLILDRTNRWRLKLLLCLPDRLTANAPVPYRQHGEDTLRLGIPLRSYDMDFILVKVLETTLSKAYAFSVLLYTPPLPCLSCSSYAPTSNVRRHTGRTDKPILTALGRRPRSFGDGEETRPCRASVARASTLRAASTFELVLS
jgi:hypothetical protein